MDYLNVYETIAEFNNRLNIDRKSHYSPQSLGKRTILGAKMIPKWNPNGTNLVPKRNQNRRPNSSILTGGGGRNAGYAGPHASLDFLERKRCPIFDHPEFATRLIKHSFRPHSITMHMLGFFVDSRGYTI